MADYGNNPRTPQTTGQAKKADSRTMWCTTPQQPTVSGHNSLQTAVKSRVCICCAGAACHSTSLRVSTVDKTRTRCNTHCTNTEQSPDQTLSLCKTNSVANSTSQHAHIILVLGTDYTVRLHSPCACPLNSCKPPCARSTCAPCKGTPRRLQARVMILQMKGLASGLDT
jgi:hypothetical protein